MMKIYPLPPLISTGNWPLHSPILWIKQIPIPLFLFILSDTSTWPSTTGSSNKERETFKPTSTPSTSKIFFLEQEWIWSSLSSHWSNVLTASLEYYNRALFYLQIYVTIVTILVVFVAAEWRITYFYFCVWEIYIPNII